MVGSLLLGVFLSSTLGGHGYAPGLSMGRQLFAQVIAVGSVALWSAVASIAIALFVARLVPMRVSEDDEREGLDYASHGEWAWEMD